MGYIKRKKRKLLLKIIIVILLLVFFIMCSYSVFEKRLSILISEIAENTVKAKAAIIVSNAIYDEIEKNDITYDKLVSFEKDKSGKITALKTNIIEINRLKSKLSVKILESLDKMDTAELVIPLGSVLGGELLSGKGPGIKIRVVPVGSVESEIENEISSAGINQSRHQIMMKVQTNLTILTSITGLSTSIETYICIAETVIVGDVPNSYTNIDNSGKNHVTQKNNVD